MRPLAFFRTTWIFLFIGTMIITLSRVIFCLSFGEKDLINLYFVNLIQAFGLGIRFDLKSLSILLLLLFLPVTLLSKWLPTRYLGSVLQRVVLGSLLLLVIALSTIQYFYYSFYHTPFDPMVFGFFEDDTQSILKAIWSDFPVIHTIVVMLVLAVGAYGLLIRLSQHPFLQNTNVEVASSGNSKVGNGLSPFFKSRFFLRTMPIVGIQILFLAYLIRGSLGTFPLNQQDATISAHPFINHIIRNAFQTLHDATVDRLQQINIQGSAGANLSSYGFQSLEDLAQTLNIPDSTPKALEDFIWRMTPTQTFLEQSPPHVVVALMESWGAQLLRYSTAETNLTGAMDKHLKSDFVFSNFFDTGTGTHPALEALLLNSPISPLTQGKNGLFSYRSAATLPFKQQGYRTIFIYGGSNAWRSLDRVMPHQYFDEVYDMASIQARYPNALRNTWGIYDEYLFQFAYDVLREKEAKHQKTFIFLLTTTNHPPHRVPPHYAALPLDMAGLPSLGSPPALAKDMAITYQYATHQLGLFLDKIKETNLGTHTIVAATGDHNLRSLLQYHSPKDDREFFRVPGYFYVPSKYQPNYLPDLKRYADQRSLFPTLYHLALSKTAYPSFSDNLFAPSPEKNQFGVVNGQALFAAQGALLPLSPKPSFYTYDRSNPYCLVPLSEPNTTLAQKGKIARAWLALADWYIRQQVLENQKN